MKRVTFPTRRAGLVHVRGRLQLQGGTPLIELAFRREDFAKMLPLAAVGEHIAYLACSMCMRLERTAGEYTFRQPDTYWGRIIDDPLPQALRRSRLTIHGTYEHDLESETREPTLHYTIKISRRDLALVDQDPMGVRRELSLLLSDPELHDGLQVNRRRPRGLRANASVMLRPVRFALLEAEQLCKMADTTLRVEIQCRLGEDYDPHPKRWRQNAIMLVSRAFSGAWAKYHVKPPQARTEGDAVDVYRALLPAAYRKSALKALREHVSNPALVHEEWRKRLLGPEGQAARDFDLIS